MNEINPIQIPWIIYKVIVIGDSGVGKTSIMENALKGTFDSRLTIGFEFMWFKVQIKDYFIKLHLWDTCGQEIFKAIASSFYRKSALAILVFALDE